MGYNTGDGLDATIRRWYGDDGLSIAKIALALNWSETAVRNRLVALGIARRTPWARNAVACEVEDLRRLYVDEGLSLEAIAQRYGCSLTTIWRKLKAAGIATRVGGSGPAYPRVDFSGNLVEKAYLCGFRQGDLHVALEGNTIVVKCTSTRTEQVVLFRELFMPYGHVYTDEATRERRKRQSIGMYARLNRSFDFLLLKGDYLPDWVSHSDETFFAYLAGYMDAEGYIHTYARPGYRALQVDVEIRSYDRVLLTSLGEGLNVRGIFCVPASIRVKAGYVNREGVRSNGDLWGLGIHRRDALRRLFELLDPYLRHGRRRRDMLRAWDVLRADRTY